MNKKGLVWFAIPLIIGIGLLILPFILIGNYGAWKFLSWMANPGQLPIWGVAIILIFLFLLITKRKE